MTDYYTVDDIMNTVDEALAETPEPEQHWEIVRDRMSKSVVLLKLWNGSLFVDSEQIRYIETDGMAAAVRNAATAIWSRREIDKYTGIYPRKDTN